MISNPILRNLTVVAVLILPSTGWVAGGQEDIGRATAQYTTVTLDEMLAKQTLNCEPWLGRVAEPAAEDTSDGGLLSAPVDKVVGAPMAFDSLTVAGGLVALFMAVAIGWLHGRRRSTDMGQ